MSTGPGPEMSCVRAAYPVWKPDSVSRHRERRRSYDRRCVFQEPLPVLQGQLHEVLCGTDTKQGKQLRVRSPRLQQQHQWRRNLVAARG